MRCVDFRNGSYQGQTKNGLPHGIGILIDQNQMFCLAQWQYGTVNGAVFAVYPDSSIFCGHLKQGKVQGMSCFFLKDQVQIYLGENSQRKNDNSYTTVLPAYHLVLEVDGSGTQPKVVKHHNYPQHLHSQDQQLRSIFGQNNQNLEHLRTWQTFLIRFFIRQYPQLLLFTRTQQSTYSEHFLRLQTSDAKTNQYAESVLGIKLVELEGGIGKNNDPVVVSAVGQFTQDGEMRGYGRRVLERVLWRKVEEGEFSMQHKRTIEYVYGNRPKQAFKMHRNHLLKSINFQDFFIPLNYLYDLQKVYAQVNVEVVEETQKIAQVVLHQGQESRVVLVEIQNKKSRKRTPLKGEDESMVLLPATIISKDEQKISYFKEKESQIDYYTQKETKEPKLITNPELKLSTAKESIYSSVKKIKNASKQKRQNAELKYKRMFIDEEVKQVKLDSPQKKPFRPINESPIPKNGIQEGRSKYSPQLPTHRNMHRSPPSPEIYTRQLHKLTENSIDKNRYNRDSLLEPSYHRSSNNYSWQANPLLGDQLQNRKIHNLSHQVIHRSPSSNSLHKRKPIFEEDIGKEYERYREGEEQISYFNAMIKQQQSTSSLFGRSQTSQGEGRMQVKRERSKTPGKIRRVKLKSEV